jgi:hypothetical protein
MKNFSLLLLVIFIIIKCQNPTVNNNDEDTYNTHLLNQDGIEVSLTIEKDNYTLDEEIDVDFLAVNKSDTNRIHIYQTSGPLHRMSIYDINNERIQFLPQYKTKTVYNLYFEPGDSFHKHISWIHSTSSNNPYSGLKAFAGKYLINFSHAGVSTSKLGKWINITEDGEPLSSKLFWNFTNADSIKLDFFIRNRISKNLDYLLMENKLPKIQFYEYRNNIPAKEIEFSISINRISLNSKSDSYLLSFNESKEYLKDIGLTGSYTCKIIIPCITRDITASGNIVIN